MKFNGLLLLSFSLLACAIVKDEARGGLDERLAEYGYRPGENVDQIASYQISAWTYLDSQHLMFSNTSGEHYFISLQSACTPLRGLEILRFKTSTNSLRKFDMVMAFTEGVIKFCRIESISRLTRAE